jgi:hypothetical protein
VLQAVAAGAAHLCPSLYYRYYTPLLNDRVALVYVLQAVAAGAAHTRVQGREEAEELLEGRRVGR